MTERISLDGPLPWMTFCGVEIANSARVMSYLAAGLGDTGQGHWELTGTPADLCGVLYRPTAPIWETINLVDNPGPEPDTIPLSGGINIPAWTRSVAASGTLTLGTAPDGSAAAFFHITSDGAFAEAGVGPRSGAFGFPVTAGRDHTLAVDLWFSAASNFWMQVAYFDAAHNFLSFAQTTVAPPTSLNAWNRYSLTVTAPGNAVYAQLIPYHGVTVHNGDAVYIRHVQFEQASAPTSYCDGDQPLCRWDGTFEKSTSSRLTVTTVSYSSPAADPAPWYDADEPGAASFLGVVPLSITGYDGVTTRSVTQRITGLGGGSFGRKLYKPRVWKFRAALVSSDGAGAEYGLRWLTSELGRGACDDCVQSCAMQVRLLCPPADASDDALGLWYSYDTVLTDGPNEVEPYVSRKALADSDVLAGCRDYVIVEWTMTSGNPWLYKIPELLGTASVGGTAGCTSICDFLFGTTSQQVCFPVEQPARGVLGTVFMLRSTVGFGSVTIEAWETCPGPYDPGPGSVTSLARSRRTRSRPTAYRKRGIPAAQPDRIVALADTVRPQHVTTHVSLPAFVTPPTPLLSMTFTEIPAGKTLVVDSAQHKLVLLDNVTGDQEDGSKYLDPASGLNWMEVRDCDAGIGCFCVGPQQPCDASFGDLTVTAYSQVREA